MRGAMAERGMTPKEGGGGSSAPSLFEEPPSPRVRMRFVVEADGPGT
jgi:hypothetical protein